MLNEQIFTQKSGRTIDWLQTDSINWKKSEFIFCPNDLRLAFKKPRISPWMGGLKAQRLLFKTSMGLTLKIFPQKSYTAKTFLDEI